MIIPILRVRAIITIRKQTVYTAFGLRLASDFPLPELMQAYNQDTPADVHIEMADLTGHWKDSSLPANHYQFINGDFVFQIPHAALFCVQDGKRILFTPAPGSDMDMIRLFLLGTCMGVILMQRGILPLHGSAVVIDGRAYAIVGDKGAGKSTLAAAFLSKGFTLLTDDVIAVSLKRGTQLPVVIPAYPQQKLWQESLDHLEMSDHGYNPLCHEASKYAVPVASRFCTEAVPLAGVFELAKADIPAKEQRQVHGLERFPILQYHTYRSTLIPVLDLAHWHFQSITNVLRHAEVYQLRRPLVGFTAHELVSEILNTVRKEA